MTGKTVVILGGGVGGLVTANESRKRLGKEHRVVLVDRDTRHIFWLSLLWLQVGLRRPDKITRELAVLNNKGIEVVFGDVRRIDPEKKAILAGETEIEADYLVASLGAQLAPERIPGLADAGHNLYSLEGATAIRDTRTALTEGNVTVLVAGMPFKCPAAPYEAAMLLEHDLRKRKVRDRVSLSLYSPEPGPMGVAGPEVSAGVRNMVEERGIDYHPQHLVREVDAASKTLHFTEERSARFDYLVYIPPHMAPPVVTEAGLTGESGLVTVDRHTMETKFDDVYAIGDVTGIPLSMGLPLPKAGVFAHHEGVAVARTIAAKITGKGEMGRFNGSGECFVEVGGGRAGFGRGNFYGEPTPTIRLYSPAIRWHLGKFFFEWNWMRKWF